MCHTFSGFFSSQPPCAEKKILSCPVPIPTSFDHHQGDSAVSALVCRRPQPLAPSPHEVSLSPHGPTTAIGSRVYPPWYVWGGRGACTHLHIPPWGVLIPAHLDEDPGTQTYGPLCAGRGDARACIPPSPPTPSQWLAVPTLSARTDGTHVHLPLGRGGGNHL